MLEILRPTRRAALVSARVFDALFERELESHARVRTVELDGFLDAVLGPADAPFSPALAAARLREHTASAAFLCPDHHAIAFAPQLAQLRNRGAAPVRLLIVAHSPGAYLLEWALLAPLLRPGDRIVAPSESAHALIAFLCPAITPFVRVIPHPMRPLPAQNDGGSDERRSTLLSLGRIVPAKLVHRQLEALARLRRRGRRDLRMLLAGPLAEPGEGSESHYVRALRSMIRQHGLNDCVQLLGEVDGDEARARLLTGAGALINLSVSIEESFGKSNVEAIGLGMPVLTSRWDGLPESVGDGGCVLPVRARTYGMDVEVDAIADGIEAVLDCPPPRELCREHARRFHPDRIAPRYGLMLEQAIEQAHGDALAAYDQPAADAPAAPAAGLLALAAPLLAFSWRELSALTNEETRALRGKWAPAAGRACAGAQLRACLLLGLRSAIERRLAGLDLAGLDAATGSTRPRHRDGDFHARMLAAVCGRGTRASRVLCLHLLWQAGRMDALREGLAQLRAEQLTSPGLDFLEVESELHAGRIAEALARCRAGEDPELWADQAAHRMCQLARVCTVADAPEAALAHLRRWTEAYGDSPDAGEVWLWRGLCAMSLDGGAREARRGLTRALELLGPRAELTAAALAVGATFPADDGSGRPVAPAARPAQLGATDDS